MDSESLSATYAVDVEIPAVRRQDLIGLEILGQHHQRRVCEVHRTVSVLAHELACAPNRSDARGHQDRPARQNEVQTGDASARDAPQEMCRFRQDGLARYDLAGPLFEKLDELAMATLAAIEQRYERAGIEQKLICHATATR